MGTNNKNDIYETAREYSKNVNCQVYVWETDSGEWLYGISFPDQYSEIIATFVNGVEVND